MCVCVGNIGSLLLLYSVEPEVTNWLDWLSSGLQGSSCLPLLFPSYKITELLVVHFLFLVGSRDQDFVPHARVASTLPTEHLS